MAAASCSCTPKGANAAWICAALICPGRKMVGAPRLQSTMVDSMPTTQSPPSSMGTAAPNSSATCAAQVGLTRPKRLALGAARPSTPRSAQVCSSASACGCAGIRRPMLLCPPAAAAATSGRRGKISVKGPGQNCCISACAKAGMSCAKTLACSGAAICTINGWSAGLPLVLKICATACAFCASAARPYTVSVGMATRPPAASAAAAWGRVSRGRVSGIVGYFPTDSCGRSKRRVWRFAGLLSLPQDCHGTVTKPF